MFEQDASDPLGKFGRFADAFDISTAMPLVVYLATEADVGERLVEALDALESFILRRDICGLTTKNYNRFFTGIIGRLRDAGSAGHDARGPGHGFSWVRVIASIHEKRAELRAEIMAASDLEREPTLGRQRARRRGGNQGARNHGPRNLGSAQALSGHG